jgi:hypothetical protein
VGQRDRARKRQHPAVTPVRPQGDDDVQAKYGEWVLDAHLPNPGTPTQGPEAGYMANAYVRMRHPDYDVLREMLDDVGRTVQVHAT